MNFYHIDDLSLKSNTPIETIEEWVARGIFIPEGRASDSTPFFSEGSLVMIDKIKSLIDLGYDPEEVKKIIKKVGLPSDSGNAGKKNNEKKNYLTVGNLAEKIEVSTRTIKHWEEKGIIEPDLRSQGGFRLYRDYYVLFCNLIKDLQLFGYSLDQIKTISDYFRDFINIRENPDKISPEDTDQKLNLMNDEIKHLFEKTDQLKNGIRRWEDLLKKQRKQITSLREKNKKRIKKDYSDEN
ncbi:MAG: MerR family transcriptional regulator [Spirochaetales bacterium]|uniref:MerR family transcriptional regulator n=1 Tax=Candidatus Thalassospirochaeta sargassi TaxID=3119039 RepID=A0AAJ1IHT0_9SPIO|nr:MerR family transcriptional regulator [Spirochaetales bacterium]